MMQRMSRAECSFTNESSEQKVFHLTLSSFLQFFTLIMVLLVIFVLVI